MQKIWKLRQILPKPFTDIHLYNHKQGFRVQLALSKRHFINGVASPETTHSKS